MGQPRTRGRQALRLGPVGSNRILGFDGLPAQNGASATFVLGQSGFTSTTERGGRDGFTSPEGTSSDGTRLAVADKGNSRVLLYNTLPASSGAEAELVLGPAGLHRLRGRVRRDDPCASRRMWCCAPGRLVVADTLNHRVLIWNTLPTANEATPSLVLGQSSLTTCASNDGNGDGSSDAAPSASTLFNPAGVWTDGTRLMVADTYNNRVLLWNTFPTTNGQPADVVLGQPGFTSRTQATTDRGLYHALHRHLHRPADLRGRVPEPPGLVWNELPDAIGQSRRTSSSGSRTSSPRNRGDPTSGSAPQRPAASTSPAACSSHRPIWWCRTTGNNRLLVFESQ